nr:MAG TPA: Disulfide bond protein A-disulfide oxidoreductase, redox protein, protein.81A [Caudoviricetes sp.]
MIFIFFYPFFQSFLLFHCLYYSILCRVCQHFFQKFLKNI